MTNYHLSYTLRVRVDVDTEGGRADREQLGEDVYDALRDAIEELSFDGISPHATKDDDVEWTGGVLDVELGEHGD